MAQTLKSALRNETLGTEKWSVETREVSLRVEAAGYGGVSLKAVFPVEALSGIERGDLPVKTSLKIKTPGYGWRAVEARVFPRDEASVPESAPDKARSVRLSVPGYGDTPLSMAFLGRAR